MKRFQEKRQLRSKLYSKTTIVLLVVLFLLLLRGAIGIYGKQVESRRLADEALHRLEEAKSRETALAEEMRKLDTPEGIEGEIRTKFNVSKPGEGVAIIVTDEVALPEAEEAGFFGKVWQKIWPWAD